MVVSLWPSICETTFSSTPASRLKVAHVSAGVKPIKFHGRRHTSATLAFQAGVPTKVVQERLAHKKIEITLSIYAYALPSMQKDAAGGLLQCFTHKSRITRPSSRTLLAATLADNIQDLLQEVP